MERELQVDSQGGVMGCDLQGGAMGSDLQGGALGCDLQGGIVGRDLQGALQAGGFLLGGSKGIDSQADLRGVCDGLYAELSRQLRRNHKRTCTCSR